MSDLDKGHLEISIPGEWAIKKLFGPVLSEFGEDLKRMYAAGRNKLLAAATRKIENIDDGKIPNLRVTRDVLWNGTFSDDEVCAEYFGGILASSRTNDGKDDSSIQFVDVIKSLSATQLTLHYVIYHTLNKMWIKQSRSINVAEGQEVNSTAIWMSLRELVDVHEIKIDTDLNALWRKGLLNEYRWDSDLVGKTSFLYSTAKPTSFGVMLYAAAHNRMDQWLQFSDFDFGSFESIEPLHICAGDLASLRKMVGLPAPGADANSKRGV